MTTTKEIQASALGGLELQPGDTFRVLAQTGSTFVVQLERPDTESGDSGVSAEAWLKTARGSVRAGAGGSAETLRDSYYAEKYGA